MKNLLLFTITFLLLNTKIGLCQSENIQFPTFAEPPGPENVLVIYKSPNNPADTISESIKNYYMLKRNIPLITHEKDITIPFEPPTGITYENDGEIIKGEGNLGWLFVRDYIANEIENHLNTTYYNGQLLRDLVRYLVLIKGIPLKIDDTTSEDLHEIVRKDVSVDALLCLINQDPEKHFTQLYGTNVPSHPIVTNPYFGVDENYSLFYQFVTNHFITDDGYKLQYLVSRLDGNEEQDVITMIDNAYMADLTGEKIWVLDHDPSRGTRILAAFLKFNELGWFNILSDAEDPMAKDIWITESEETVIGYDSYATYACKNSGQCMPGTYIIDGTLNFEYAPGAVYNSQESYNGATFYQQYRGNQSLVTDFIQMGGTGGVGNAWEPAAPNVCLSAISYPLYAVGYPLIDAFYQGIPEIAFRQTVVGDPLTRIYDCRETIISSNTTIGSGNYSCDMIVPEGITLTIASSAEVNFDRNANLKVSGTLIIESNAVINFNNYSHLFLDEGSGITVEQNGSVHFNNRSTFFVDIDFHLDEYSPFYFGVSSNIVSDASFEISGDLTLTMGSIIINGSAELSESSTLSLLGTQFKVNGSLTLALNAHLNFNGYYNTLNNYGVMHLSSGSVFNISNTSKFFSKGKVYLDEGVIINQNNSSANSINIAGGVFKSLGSLNNRVAINYISGTPSSYFKVGDVDTLLLSHTVMNSGSISLNVIDGIQKPRLISITNSVINNSFSTNGFSIINTEAVNVILSDNQINCNVTNGTGLAFSGFNSVQLIRNTIQNTSTNSFREAINIKNNKVFELRDCDVIDFKNGIVQGHVAGEETELINNEDIRIYSCTIQGMGYDQEGTGILLGYDPSIITLAAKIDLNNISGFSSCIAVNNPNNFPVGITNNT